MIERLAEWLTGLLAAAGGPGIFVAMLVESACIPLPSEVILPFAGILAREGHMTYAAAVGWSMGGQMTGSLLTYYVGMLGGRPLVLRYGKYLLIREHELHMAERWFARHGEVTAFVTRLLPGVRTFISLPAGVARMPVWRFLAYSFLGALPWTAFLVWAGMKVGKIWQNPDWHWVFRTVEVAVAVALIWLVVRFARTRRRTGDPAV